MTTHALAVFGAERVAEATAARWPRAYLIPRVDGWALFRVDTPDPDDLPPPVRALCVCGEFH